MKKQKYNIIYSIGADCACATYMSENKLRSYSSPFDWLTIGSFENRINLISNDFKDFINIEDLKFQEKNSNMFNDEKCDYYENIRTGLYFWHDFPKGVVLQKSLPEVKEKYDRRINRFNKKIKKSKRVLLIWLAHNHQNDSEIVIKLCDNVCKKFNKKIDFLIIEHDKNKQKGEIETIHLSPNITRYKLYTMGFDENGRPTTMGNVEDCNRIFSQYQLIIPFKKKVLSFVANLVSSFIFFNKDLRKRTKKAIKKHWGLLKE